MQPEARVLSNIFLYKYNLLVNYPFMKSESAHKLRDLITGVALYYFEREAKDWVTGIGHITGELYNKNCTYMQYNAFYQTFMLSATLLLSRLRQIQILSSIFLHKYTHFKRLLHSLIVAMISFVSTQKFTYTV